jgi:hypothetical protein
MSKETFDEIIQKKDKKEKLKLLGYQNTSLNKNK